MAKVLLEDSRIDDDIDRAPSAHGWRSHLEEDARLLPNVRKLPRSTPSGNPGRIKGHGSERLRSDGLGPGPSQIRLLVLDLSPQVIQ